MATKQQLEEDEKNLIAVRAYFSSHLCATKKECADALGLPSFDVGRHMGALCDGAGLSWTPVPESPAASPVHQAPAVEAPEKHRASHVGAPAVFALELACQELNRAFGYAGGLDGHCYLVGSALERADRRDVDIRLIMPDGEFDALFPAARGRYWEHDPRWLIMTIAISKWLSEMSGVPVDFQFQRQSNANERHKGRRDAMGMIFASPSAEG